MATGETYVLDSLSVSSLHALYVIDTESASAFVRRAETFTLVAGRVVGGVLPPGESVSVYSHRKNQYHDAAAARRQH